LGIIMMCQHRLHNKIKLKYLKPLLNPYIFEFTSIFHNNKVECVYGSLINGIRCWHVVKMSNEREKRNIFFYFSNEAFRHLEQDIWRQTFCWFSDKSQNNNSICWFQL
jgi:hypothetical protein